MIDHEKIELAWFMHAIISIVTIALLPGRITKSSMANKSKNRASVVDVRRK